MDKEDNLINEEEDNMSAVAKEQGYKKLSLSPKKLQEITIRPVVVRDGKFLFDRNNKDHRYIAF